MFIELLPRTQDGVISEQWLHCLLLSGLLSSCLLYQLLFLLFIVYKLLKDTLLLSSLLLVYFNSTTAKSTFNCTELFGEVRGGVRKETSEDSV